MESAPGSNLLLGPGDPQPVKITNEAGRSPFLLLGDHAGRAVPKRLDRLGLPAGAMDRHIAWDIGVSGLGARLAAVLDACFIEQVYSRLVIDCNRRPGALDSIPAVSDGAAIPGNAPLGAADAAARVAEVHGPYHAAIAAHLEARAQRGQPSLLISLHSFTPVLQGQARPWRFGVLHRQDSELSFRMLRLLRETAGDAVGDNQPYAMDSTDYTLPLHADPRGLDYLELEVRQDLIGDGTGQDQTADLIAGLLGRCLAPSA